MINHLKRLEDFKAQLKRAPDFRRQMKRPFVIISYAQSLDGSIAARNKTQVHLSGQASLVLTHHLRAISDVILVGIETVLADNPRLNVRRVEGNNPQPVILDTHLRIPIDSKLIRRSDMRSWIISGKNNAGDRSSALQHAGAKIFPCATTDDGKIDLEALMKILAAKRINTVMVEGGAKVITSFVNCNLVDQFIITITPKLMGGLQVIDNAGLKATPYLKLGDVGYQHVEEDLILWARPLWEAE
jgi:3,4-dihydroxy 2-butanone 4-phosphate synthase/GTP cyclohydrolase II